MKLSRVASRGADANEAPRPALLPPSIEPIYLHLTLAFAFLTYSRAVHLILDGFCTYLGIKALTIPFPNKAVEGWEPLPTQAHHHSSSDRRARPPQNDDDDEERQLELEMERLSSPTKRGNTASGGGGGGDKNLLNVVPSPFKNLLGSGEGRKRSNTSERERGIASPSSSAGDGSRRLAKVFPADSLS